MMFSATFPQEMQDMALDFLDPSYLWVSVGRVGATTSNVEQRFEDVTGRFVDKFSVLLDALENFEKPEGGRAKTIVFANQKNTVDDIAAQLSNNRIRCTQIHGGLSQPARDRALASLKSGRADVLVATDVAARGLDLPGIDHVVNYELPGNAEDYVHRVGRTGRIGNTGVATSFVGGRESALKDIVKNLKDARRKDENVSEVPDWVERLAVMSSRGSSRGGRSRSMPPMRSAPRSPPPGMRSPPRGPPGGMRAPPRSAPSRSRSAPPSTRW